MNRMHVLSSAADLLAKRDAYIHEAGDGDDEDKNTQKIR